MNKTEWEAEMERLHAKMRANQETMGRLKEINGPLASTVKRRIDEVEKKNDNLGKPTGEKCPECGENMLASRIGPVCMICPIPGTYYHARRELAKALAEVVKPILDWFARLIRRVSDE